MRAARAWHLLTALVAAGALTLQLVLVLQGGRVLEEAHPPSMTLRLLRFIAYFTIQSNILGWSPPPPSPATPGGAAMASRSSGPPR